MQNRASKYSVWFWEKLCFLTAYLHVISMIIEIGVHILMVLIFTGGLQCDTDLNALHKNWTSFEKIIHVTTLGVHGFSPFLVPYSAQLDTNVYTVTVESENRCCSGIIHLPVLDALVILINLIWFKCVLSFYYSQYEKDVKKMQLFLKLAMLKLFMEVVYKAMRNNSRGDDMFNFDVSWNSEMMNFFLYIFMLTSVYYRIKFLVKGTEKTAPTITKIQAEGDKNNEKTEQSIADEEKEKPPAYLLV